MNIRSHSDVCMCDGDVGICDVRCACVMVKCAPYTCVHTCFSALSCLPFNSSSSLCMAVNLPCHTQSHDPPSITKATVPVSAAHCPTPQLPQLPKSTVFSPWTVSSLLSTRIGWNLGANLEVLCELLSLLPPVPELALDGLQLALHPLQLGHLLTGPIHTVEALTVPLILRVH